MDIEKTLNILSSAFGLSSFEDSVIEKTEKICKPLSDKTYFDKAGNLIAYKKGTEGKNKVIIATHIDEIGLIVSGIEENGLLRFNTIGGVDIRILPGSEVVVLGEKHLNGVIGSIPPHFQNRGGILKPYEKSELYIDTGFDGKSIRKYVDIGTPVAFRPKFINLKNSKCSNKSFDNRSSCVASLYVLELLRKYNHKWDVYSIFTLQEEYTMLGGRTAGYNTIPDLAIAMDATFGQQPGVSDDQGYDIDKVLTISRGPNLHIKATEDLMDLADEEKIPYEIEVSPRMSGTDAMGLQTTGKGIPTVLISLPIRNMHTSLETININIIKTASKLVARFIASLDSNYENRFE
jgi:endoglucanase